MTENFALDEDVQRHLARFWAEAEAPAEPVSAYPSEDYGTLMLIDMIEQHMGWRRDDPAWQEAHNALLRALDRK